VAAFETLVAISSVRNSIRERKTHQISSVIQTGGQHGMMSLDQSLAHLARSGVITFDEGEGKAKNRAEYQQLVRTGEAVGV
jgi:twitching motility protein PilT